jgi:hypothetical protein
MMPGVQRTAKNAEGYDHASAPLGSFGEPAKLPLAFATSTLAGVAKSQALQCGFSKPAVGWLLQQQI